jgi:Methylase of polypeptide chain release factors
VQISALDFSEDILRLAKSNAELNDVKIDLISMDILSEIPDGSWHMLVSNPPYIVPSERLDMSPGVLDHEPPSALFVPEDNPLLFYDRIAELGLRILEKGGVLFFEINPLFHSEMLNLLKTKGYRNIEMKKDISGKERMMKAVL